jgi:dTDP-4-amino-4,6-dideoxygalactose transaminase
VDNAHGYGLAAEGDFTVYSINQGKFPALGEGGILIVNSEKLRVKSLVDDFYAQLPAYGFAAQVKLFVQMLVKAIAYSRLCYWMVMWLKRVSGLAVSGVGEKIVMRKMAPGVRRLYCAALPEIPKMIDLRRQNAAKIDDAFYGDNAFMAVVRCKDPEELKREFAKRGVETETHFKHCIEWAKVFGYRDGSCPNAEKLTQKLVMIPTYTKI